MEQSKEYQLAANDFTLAKEFAATENWDKAIFYFCQVLERFPRNIESYTNLGAILNTVGRLDEAEACLRKALEYDSTAANAYYNLGMVYEKKGLLADAEFCLRQFLAMNPHAPDVENSLGILLERQYRLTEAEGCYRRAIQLQPDFSIAYYNLGNLLKITKNFKEAEHFLLRATQLAANNYKFDMALAFFYLSLAQYETGWKYYRESLDKLPDQPPFFPIPHWRGEDLTNSSLLLYGGKGFGDTIHFVRYLPQIAAIARQVVCCVQQPLQRLLQENYPSFIIYSEEELQTPQYDFAASLQELPILLNTTEKTIPAFPHYLQAPPKDIEVWRNILADFDKRQCRRIGIVWSGNPFNLLDEFRSIPFKNFEILLAAHPELSWISLQVGERAKDCKNTTNILDVTSMLVDFGQTAGLIANLDLVITTDTAVAHLASALGKNTWILLNDNCDWRWLLEREDNPWYPSMRLFRQQKPGDWAEVLSRVSKSLFITQSFNRI